MSKCKVSVITATWNRHDMLVSAMKSLAAQTYTDWEHIIVSDGRDPSLESVVLAAAAEIGHPYNYKLVQLGRNWHELSGKLNFGGMPRNVGTYIAEGEYIGYLDDDNEYTPNHLEDLVAKLEEGYDCAYGMAEIYFKGEFVKHMGDGKPRYGELDTSMVLHRWDLIRTANWKTEKRADDWEFHNALIEAGFKFGWVPKVTLRYNKVIRMPGSMTKEELVFLDERLPDISPVWATRDPSEGVITSADTKIFLGLQMLIMSIRGRIPLVVFDLGLTEAERAWCRSKGVDVRSIENHLDVGGDWRYYIKPFAIRLSPFKRTLWTDADTIFVGDPDPLFRRMAEKPFAVEHWDAPGYHPNDEEAYAMYPVFRFPLSVNNGVLGFDLVRDKMLLDEFANAVDAVCSDDKLRGHVQWWDEGCYHLAVQKCDMPDVVVKHKGWNRLIHWTLVKDVTTFVKAFPLQLPEGEVIWHFSGKNKPWTDWVCK